MIHDAAPHKRNRNGELNEQPNNDIDSLRLFEQFACIFNAKHRLRYHDRTVHPTLGAESLAIWIRYIDVVLSKGNKKKERTDYIFSSCHWLDLIWHLVIIKSNRTSPTAQQSNR